VDGAPDLVVRARRVVLDVERPAAIAISGGRIVAVDAVDRPFPGAREVVVADSVAVLPGLVDSHVHLQEPGPVHLEGFATGTRSAAAGGVTTVVDMPLDCVPATLDRGSLEAKRAAAQSSGAWVDLAFWGGVTPANLGRLAELDGGGAVVGFKAYLCASGHPGFAPVTYEQLEAAMVEVAGLGSVLAVHAEDAAELARGARRPHVLGGNGSGGGHRYRDLLVSRPHEVETVAVAAVVAAARRTGARVHIVHVSSAGAADLLARARSDGVAVSGETCPHYLALAAEAVPDGAVDHACSPPIREAANADRLWQHLAEGTLSMVVSDHSPLVAPGTDPGTDFGRAPGGIVSLQVSLPVTWTAARARGVPLATVARWMSGAPAELAGLTRKGRIAVGMDADLCFLAPEAEFVVHDEALHHRSGHSVYHGRILDGVVREVWLRGSPVDLTGPARGRLLSRSRPEEDR